MQEPQQQSGDFFPRTQWTVILDASSHDSESARAAMEKLFAAYRQPILNWFQRMDYAHDAEDLTHGFMAYVLEKNLLSRISANHGKFRFFLLACMRNYLRDLWDRDNAAKRGGKVEKLPLNDDDLPVDAESRTDFLLDVGLALEIHKRVMVSLPSSKEIIRYLFDKDSQDGWKEVAMRLNTTATAIRKAVGRLRLQHYELFRNEVAQMASRSDLNEETKYLYLLLFKYIGVDKA